MSSGEVPGKHARKGSEEPRRDETLIRTPERLQRLLREIESQEVIGVDTEFHGEKRYYPELFLVQISTRNACYALDPLEFEDLSPLGRVLGNRGIVKAIHSARNDIAILRREAGVEVESVFDTQIAASFLGYGEQCGLTFLLGEVCGIPFPRSFSMSDWSRRPLSDEQLTYALDDVRHLLALYSRLRGMLLESGRLEWCLDEMAHLSLPRTYETGVESIYSRVRSSARLRRKGGEAVLWELVRWREETARREDRPRNRVVSDGVLQRIASMSPTSVESLRTLRGLPGGLVESRGEEIARLVSRALAHPSPDIPGDTRRRMPPGASARRDVLRIYAKSRASELGIARTVLLPGDLLDSLAALGARDADRLGTLPGLEGWRQDVMGEDLRAILTGRMSFSLAGSPGGGVSFSIVRERSESSS
ncbi:ribonuclease D [Candidatus Fermentibacterales bacterium]|nr:ribonuclease D [Candidatus Fermentibacterales bacterium]